MSMLGSRRVKPQQAYVIVCGNEKGGSGKTTTAMHLAVALLMGGHKVATIDLDTRQLSFSRYIENRIAWNRRKGLSMLVPDHFRLEKAAGDSINDNETVELGRFQDILRQVEHSHDFILIDTPGHDNFAMRLAHSMADTLVTPINDFYVDFDVLARIDPATGDVVDTSHYANMVRDARRHGASSTMACSTGSSCATGWRRLHPQPAQHGRQPEGPCHAARLPAGRRHFGAGCVSRIFPDRHDGARRSV